MFQAQCATCHAADARGSSFAPYYDELWSFLRARITGDLPAGPVTRLPEDEGAAASGAR